MTTGMNNDIARDAADLTQLSSREQLSALMDGALPADETRFLLRRLQHDGSLAESWERWRLSAEVMRGLAPAQRLPTDFASRVAASLHGEEALAQASLAQMSLAQASGGARSAVTRTPTWLRWGGGAAVAASLAVAAVMTRPAMMPPPDAVAVATADAASPSSVTAPAKAPTPQLPAQDPGGRAIDSQTVALAAAVAVAARPIRNNRQQARATGQAPSSQQAVMRMQEPEAVLAANDGIPALLPPADIVTRPWPRAVLPQYNDAGISVGFGNGAQGAAPYNPFQARTSIGDMAPTLIAGQDANLPASDDAGKAPSNQPPQPQAQP